jgi:hypothetical protein
MIPSTAPGKSRIAAPPIRSGKSVSITLNPPKKHPMSTVENSLTLFTATTSAKLFADRIPFGGSVTNSMRNRLVSLLWQLYLRGIISKSTAAQSKDLCTADIGGNCVKAFLTIHAAPGEFPQALDVPTDGAWVLRLREKLRVREVLTALRMTIFWSPAPLRMTGLGRHRPPTPSTSLRVGSSRSSRGGISSPAVFRSRARSRCCRLLRMRAGHPRCLSGACALERLC